jgi:hypothetical protein
VVEDQDVVGALHAGQTMGHDDPAAPTQERLDGPIDPAFRRRVEARRRLIEDHQAGIFEEHAGEGEHLRLSGGEPAATGGDHAVKSGR